MDPTPVLPLAVQHAPSLADMIGYYINQYAPTLAVPITYGIKKAYDIATEVRDLMIRQNEILDELSKELKKP